jgi:hypothetical protein
MPNAVFEKGWIKPLEALSAEDKLRIGNCVAIRRNAAQQYWGPFFNRGRKALEFYEGRIFTPDEIAEFEGDDKLVVQIPKARPAIEAIYGTLIDTLKDGVVTANGPEDAAGQNVMTNVLKDVERRNFLKMKTYECARNTGITSVPGWLWVDNKDPDDCDAEGISLDYQEWDSVLPSPRWRDRQLRDMDWCIRVRQMSLDEIEQKYGQALTGTGIKERMQYLEGTATSTYLERERVIEDIRNGLMAYDGTGMLSIFEMVHWVRMETMIYVEPDGSTGILPMQWGPEQIAMWAEMNPQAEITRGMERVLWVTTVDTMLHVLANGPHWLQSGQFPGVPCLPDRVNGKWVGMVEPIMDLLKSEAYSMTELIHTIRTTSNNLWKIRKGAVTNLDEFRRNMTRPNGIIEIEAAFSQDDVTRVENNRPQQAFEMWANFSAAQLSEQLVEQNFIGGSQTSQESDKVVQTRIKQTISKLAMPVYGLHEFWLRVHKLIVKSAPYAIKAEKIIRLVDPTNGMETKTIVNEGVEWNPDNGDVYRTINNLQGADYDYIESESDNSATGQEHERNLLREFFESHANSDPTVMEAAALEWPSVKVQAFGKKMKEAREAKEQAPPPPPEVKYAVSLSGKDLGLDAANKIAVNIGALKPDQVEESEPTPPEGLPTQAEEMQYA